MIAKNDLMSSILIDKLGMQLFKELIESKANYVFEHNKTVEISKKFYEIYDLPNTKEQKITFNFKVNNIYEASKSLNSEKFIEYLTNNKPTTSEFMMINNLKKLNTLKKLQKIMPKGILQMLMRLMQSFHLH